jgi:hypothetical protein
MTQVTCKGAKQINLRVGSSGCGENAVDHAELLALILDPSELRRCAAETSLPRRADAESGYDLGRGDAEGEDHHHGLAHFVRVLPGFRFAGVLLVVSFVLCTSFPPCLHYSRALLVGLVLLKFILELGQALVDGVELFAVSLCLRGLVGEL